MGNKSRNSQTNINRILLAKPNGNVGNSYLGPQQLRNIAVMNHSRARNDEVRNRKKVCNIFSKFNFDHCAT